MAFGKRIKNIRHLRGFTQKELGERVGFSGKAADIRIAQYESETRKPKGKIADALAFYLDVPTNAIDIPDIDTYIGVMHTLFALEDEYGFEISDMDGTPCIILNRNFKQPHPFSEIFNQWKDQYKKFLNGEITKEEYDVWRYSYPASTAFNTKK